MPVNLLEGTSAEIKLDMAGPEVTASSFEVPAMLNWLTQIIMWHLWWIRLTYTYSTVKTGRGYEPADLRGEEETQVGKIDASFSPVKELLIQ